MIYDKIFSPENKQFVSIYSKLGNLELAITHYKKAIDINPKQSQTFNNLGNAYQKLGNKIDAEKSILAEIFSKLIRPVLES